MKPTPKRSISFTSPTAKVPVDGNPVVDATVTVVSALARFAVSAVFVALPSIGLQSGFTSTPSKKA